jgi:hypothetical protein
MIDHSGSIAIYYFSGKIASTKHVNKICCLKMIGFHQHRIERE